MDCILWNEVDILNNRSLQIHGHGQSRHTLYKTGVLTILTGQKEIQNK